MAVGIRQQARYNVADSHDNYPLAQCATPVFTPWSSPGEAGFEPAARRYPASPLCTNQYTESQDENEGIGTRNYAIEQLTHEACRRAR